MKKEKVTAKIDKEIYKKLQIYKISVGAETVSLAIQKLLDTDANVKDTLEYLETIKPK